MVVLYRLGGLSNAPLSQQTETHLEPIYPQGSSQPGAEGMEKAAERHVIEVKPGYLWDTADRRVAFVDRYENDSWLVVVELEDGHVKSSRRLKLDVASVLGMPKDDSRFAETLQSERTGIPITGLHWAGENTVALEIDRSRVGQGYLYRSSELVVNVSGH